MKLQQYLLNNYLNVEFENFSQKAVLALGILKSIKHNPMRPDQEPGKDDPIQIAINQVQKIIDDTHKDIRISLFILDRRILPQDQVKNGENLVIVFKYKSPLNGQSSVSLSQDQIQNYLCMASSEIHQVLMQHIAAFSEQMFFESGNL